MNWKNNVESTLAPLCAVIGTLSVMLREWSYTGEVADSGNDLTQCELCGHCNIRYQFLIRNRSNDNRLLIGSECIKRFGIEGLDEKGNTINAKQTATKVDKDLNRLAEQARRKRVNDALHATSALRGAENFITYHEERGAFTPDQLKWILPVLRIYGTEVNPVDFRMIIRRDREKAQLTRMQLWQIQHLWPSMSKAQRQWYRESKRLPSEWSPGPPRIRDIAA